MKVLMATSWNTICGIADYAEQAIRAVRSADQEIDIYPSAEALDPAFVQRAAGDGLDVLWLNYHRALHSRWTYDATREVTARLGCKLLVTFHDTRGEAEPDSLQVALHSLADAFVVHEPVLGLPRAHLIRQGVPAGVGAHAYGSGTGGDAFLAYPNQPILGTVGFNQGWRSFDDLARITAESGWALVILSCNAGAEDEARWRSLNPHLSCVRQWLPVEAVVSRLAGCDATAFVHACANTGTSGTIRLGIAARKPVIAVEGRQYRDLLHDPLGMRAILWVGDIKAAATALTQMTTGGVDTAAVALATRDSWTNQGRKYAQILREITQ